MSVRMLNICVYITCSCNTCTQKSLNPDSDGAAISAILFKVKKVLHALGPLSSRLSLTFGEFFGKRKLFTYLFSFVFPKQLDRFRLGYLFGVKARQINSLTQESTCLLGCPRSTLLSKGPYYKEIWL